MEAWGSPGSKEHLASAAASLALCCGYSPLVFVFFSRRLSLSYSLLCSRLRRSLPHGCAPHICLGAPVALNTGLEKRVASGTAFWQNDFAFRNTQDLIWQSSSSSPSMLLFFSFIFLALYVPAPSPSPPPWPETDCLRLVEGAAPPPPPPPPLCHSCQVY